MLILRKNRGILTGIPPRREGRRRGEIQIDIRARILYGWANQNALFQCAREIEGVSGMRVLVFLAVIAVLCCGLAACEKVPPPPPAKAPAPASPGSPAAAIRGAVSPSAALPAAGGPNAAAPDAKLPAAPPPAAAAPKPDASDVKEKTPEKTAAETAI
jgi:hypothetical protein